MLSEMQMNQINFYQEGPKFSVSCNEKVENDILFVYLIIFVIVLPNVEDAFVNRLVY